MRKNIALLFFVASVAGCSSESNTARLDEKQVRLEERVESLETKLHETNKQLTTLTVELEKTREQMNDLALVVSRVSSRQSNR